MMIRSHFRMSAAAMLASDMTGEEKMRSIRIGAKRRKPPSGKDRSKIKAARQQRRKQK